MVIDISPEQFDPVLLVLFFVYTWFRDRNNVRELQTKQHDVLNAITAIQSGYADAFKQTNLKIDRAIETINETSRDQHELHEKASTRDDALLKISLANNEFLKRFAGVNSNGQIDKSHVLRQRQAVKDLQDYAANNGVDMSEWIRDAMAEMDE